MDRSETKQEPIDWDAMELEAFNLRFEPISPKDKLEKAQRLAATFWKHNKPLPDEIANAGPMQNYYGESSDSE